MNKTTFLQLLVLYARFSGKEINRFDLSDKNTTYHTPLPGDPEELAKALNMLTDSSLFAFNLHHLPADSFGKELHNYGAPLILFGKEANSPLFILHEEKKSGKLVLTAADDNSPAQYTNMELIHSLAAKKQDLVAQNKVNNDGFWSGIPDNEFIFLSGYPIPSLFTDKHKKGAAIHPVKRIFRLLKTEKKDIGLIYFYAIMMGLVSLSLPLGIQAIIGLISGGLFINSVIVLMLLVIVATLVSGWLQILQLSVVELLQQRLFAKAAVEFTFRIPRIKTEALHNQYAPELMNRFFDVLSIQKSLPKILIDLSTAGIQIIFGLTLLSLYHPLFIFFGLLILGLITLIFYFTGPRAVESNLQASKYKYKVAYWLEELARSMNTFKLAGNTPLPMQKTDRLLDQYLIHRQTHFKTLVKQFKAIIAFKTFITGGLLILGGVLVVEKQINLGQFVAAEVIILLVLASVEKLISVLESVYDLITAADKVGQVTDIELDSNNGILLEQTPDGSSCLEISLKNISYTYPDSEAKTLDQIHFSYKTGERICICGYNGSGKSTLMKIIAGMYTNYKGQILINGTPLAQLNLHSYRSNIADNLSDQDIFEGTIAENISLGRSDISYADMMTALKQVQLEPYIFSLPNGIQTHLQAGGNTLSKSNKEKLLLARSIAGKPGLMLIDEFFYNAEKKERNSLIDMLFASNNPWGIIIISNDQEIMKKCDRLVLMDSGRIVSTGSYKELINTDIFNRI